MSVLVTISAMVICLGYAFPSVTTEFLTSGRHLTEAEYDTSSECVDNPSIEPFVSNWEDAWKSSNPDAVAEMMTETGTVFGPNENFSAEGSEEIKKYVEEDMEMKGSVRKYDSVLLVPRETGFVWVWNAVIGSGGDETELLGIDFAKMDGEGKKIDELYSFGYDRMPGDPPVSSLGTMAECPNEKAREIATKFQEDMMANDVEKLMESIADNAVAVGPNDKVMGSAMMFERLTEMFEKFEVKNIDEIDFIPLEKGYIVINNITVGMKESEKEKSIVMACVVGLNKDNKISSVWSFPQGATDPREEIADKLMELWNEKDVTGIADLFADDANAEWEKGTMAGKEEIQTKMMEVFKTMDAKYSNFTAEVKSYIPFEDEEGGDGFVLEWITTAIKKENDEEKTIKGVDIIRLNEEGKIANTTSYMYKLDDDDDDDDDDNNDDYDDDDEDEDENEEPVEEEKEIQDDDNE